VTTGGAGEDRITESNGRNTRGGTGRDHLIGHGKGNLNGDEGDDRLEADAEATVTLWDGPGNDTYVANNNRQVLLSYYFSPRPVRVNLPAQRATGQGRDRLIGVVAVAGSHHADVLIGDAAANTLTGLVWWEEDRDDPGAAGADRISGGPGDDVIEALGPGSVVRGDTGNDRIRVAGRAMGGPGADSLAGAELDDQLFGGPGRDAVDGGEGTDRCTAESVTNCER
jgi:Ca2+-binding RTX toxin-like protein